jgi:hypothetical protein
MKNKTTATALILIIASTWISTGVSFAADVVQVSQNTVTSGIIVFTDVVSISDNETFKDIAYALADISDNKNMVVTLNNAYPGYAAYINFTITFIGQGGPIMLYNLIPLLPINTGAILVDLEGIEGKYIWPGIPIEGQLKVELKHGASMGAVYSFDITLGFSDSPQPSE